MGFFSNLFSKTKSENNISISINPTIVEEEIEIPPYQGDYAKSIFLNVYAKASPIKKDNEYQRYILYECGIQNPSEYHKKLIEEGYLSKASNKDVLNSFKSSELKEILKERSLSVSGKKEDLVLRLLEVIDDNFIRNHTKNVTYSITEKGKAFLEEHKGYVFIHKHNTWGITWQEYDAQREKYNNVNDVIWKILNDRIIKDGFNSRCTYFDMYQLLVEENKREQALQMLLRVIYLDVSGIDGLNFIEQYKAGYFDIAYAREYFECVVMLAPGVLKHVSEFSDIYYDGYIDRLYEWKLPIQLCGKDLFKSFIHSLIDDSYDEDEFKKKLKNSYYEILREIK